MIKKTPERKRKRAIKRIFVASFITLGVLLFLGGIGYYLTVVVFKKPLYISPLSGHQTVGADGGRQNIQDPDDEDNFENELKKGLKEKHIEFSSIVASGSAYTFRLKDEALVTFSSQKDLQLQISSLQFILSRLTMEGRKIRNLDLRFEKPVIVFDK